MTVRAHEVASAEQIEDWVEQFHRRGYLFLEGVLPAETVATLREDLNDVLRDEPPRTGGSQIQLHPRMFESSAANLSLSDMEPIVSFAEALVEPTCDVEGFDELDVDCWFRGDPAPTIRQVAGHCRRINEVDTTLPVIINANGRLMDGGHRLARALLDGRKTILAVQFEEMPEPDQIEELA